MTFLIITPHK